jgi:hypothetical protein
MAKLMELELVSGDVNWIEYGGWLGAVNDEGTLYLAHVWGLDSDPSVQNTALEYSIDLDDIPGIHGLSDALRYGGMELIDNPDRDTLISWAVISAEYGALHPDNQADESSIWASLRKLGFSCYAASGRHEVQTYTHRQPDPIEDDDCPDRVLIKESIEVFDSLLEVFEVLKGCQASSEPYSVDTGDVWWASPSEMDNEGLRDGSTVSTSYHLNEWHKADRGELMAMLCDHRDQELADRRASMAAYQIAQSAAL